MNRRNLAFFVLLLGHVLSSTNATGATQDAEPFEGATKPMTETPILLPDDTEAVRFQAFFLDFANAVKTGQTRDLYAEEAYLNDSLKEVRGAEEIEDYFVKTLEMASRVDIRFDDVAVSGDNYYFRWTMDVVAAKLNGGELIRSQGMSHILFDDAGKVAMHRDYWDSSSGLLEYIPLLGGMIRWVKGRL